MGVGMCLYSQLAQTKNKQCIESLIDLKTSLVYTYYTTFYFSIAARIVRTE